MAVRTLLANILGRAWHDRRGVVSMEAALVITSMLLPITLGSIQLGLIFHTQARLDTALQAGLQNMWATGKANDTAISKAATDNWGSNSPKLTIQPAATAYYCNASDGTKGSVSSTSPPTCASGQTAATYVTLAMSAVPPGVFTLQGIPVPSTLYSKATVRTQ